MIAGIFLAAGRSARFGSPKLLHEINGKPLVYYSLRACLASRFSAVYVVAGSTAIERAIAHDFENHEKLTILRNPNPERGMMSSLKIGLRSLGPEHVGAMVLLADMPLVPPALIDRLLATFEHRNGIIIPLCNGQWRHPRVIPKRLFSEFLALRDDEKGLRIIEAASDEIVTVEVAQAGDFLDIDRLEDIGDLEGLLSP